MPIHSSNTLNLPVIQSVSAVVEVMAVMMRKNIRRSRYCARGWQS